MRRHLLYVVMIVLVGNALLKQQEQPKEPKFHDWDRAEDCQMAVGQFADRGTDLWYEQMEQCVYTDPDYLTPIYEGEK